MLFWKIIVNYTNLNKIYTTYIIRYIILPTVATIVKMYLIYIFINYKQQKNSILFEKSFNILYDTGLINSNILSKKFEVVIFYSSICSIITL